jgi:ribonuclease J
VARLLDGAAERRMADELARHGVELEVRHVSGHAYVGDMQRLVAALSPGRIIPIHTPHPERYCELFVNTTRVSDGQWWHC